MLLLLFTAIREDRTRGGRSTYQCSYALPPSLAGHQDFRSSSSDIRPNMIEHHSGLTTVKLEPADNFSHSKRISSSVRHVPPLLQEIMDVEHLWHYSDSELNKLNSEMSSAAKQSSGNVVHTLSTHPLLAGTNLATSSDTNPDFISNLCNIADLRLYKIVKWCKSLPLFKNISVSFQYKYI